MMFKRLRQSGKKLTGSLAAALFGLSLCLGSVVILWINEGRPDLSQVAQNATIVEANSTGDPAQDLLVSITGKVEVEEALADGRFGVSADYLRLTRGVEVYQKVEKEKDSDSVTYEFKWVEKEEEEETFNARYGLVGNFRFDPENASLPKAESLSLSSKLGAVEGYIYRGLGSLAEPEVGDKRVSYTAVPAGGTVTLFGKLRGQEVEPYLDDGPKVYGIWEGSHDEALAAMHSAYVSQGWAMRFVGLLLMWGGMNLVLRPLTALLDWIPLVGNLGKAAIWVVTLIVAFVISLIIIIISFVFHRWYLLLAAVILGLGVVAYLIYHQRREQVEGTA